MTLVQGKSFTSGNFEMVVDGHPATAFLKSVDGGSVRANPLKEAIGPDNMQIVHNSTVQIEPLSIECGLSWGSDNILLKWIQESWRKNYSRKNGQITHADFNLNKTFEHEFFNALITETTFPTLDGSSKDPAYLKLKLQPEHVTAKKASGHKIGGSGFSQSAKQKLWLCSGFRLTIDGVAGMEYTNKIDSFTIKQGIKQLYTGQDRFPQIEPTKIEFPNLTGTISLQHADALLEWHHSYVENGLADTDAQKTGSLEFLTPDKKSNLFRINLYEIGIHHAQVLQSTANSDQIKRVKFELYIGGMDIDGAGDLGME